MEDLGRFCVSGGRVLSLTQHPMCRWESSRSKHDLAIAPQLAMQGSCRSGFPRDSHKLRDPYMGSFLS